MTNASYVVVRYVADPARNEPLNVGVLAWNARGHRLAIDSEAVARVIRENPRLHVDALATLPDAITDLIDLEEGLPPGEIRERLAQASGFPVMFSEPRATTVNGEATGLEEAVERLVSRIVSPRRRGGRGAPNWRQQLETRLGTLIERGAVHSHHSFATTRTGVPRVVDFFVNSGRNVALDTLRLDLKIADEIRLRADAEANKISDIRARNQVRVLVAASLPTDEEMMGAGYEARQILEAADATVIASLDDAIVAIEGAVQA